MMRRGCAKTASLLLFLLQFTFSNVLGAAEIFGAPKTILYPQHADLYPQNFSLAQTNDGRVFVGNLEALLIFDRVRWRSVELPDDSFARSLLHDPATDRVYVGGYDDFGYVDTDAVGQERYTSLKSLLPEPHRDAAFADIWNMVLMHDGVVFRALRHTFYYRPAQQSITVWEHAGRFGMIVRHAGELLLQFRGEGLKRLVDGRFELVPGSTHLDELIFVKGTLADGRLLIGRNDGQWEVFDGTQFAEFDSPLSAFSSRTVRDPVRLPGGVLAFGTDDGRILVLEPAADRLRQFRISGEHLAQLVWGQSGHLLVVSDSGVRAVDWPAAWTLTGPQSGIHSGTRQLKHWNDALYVLTSGGVFISAGLDDNGTSRFIGQDWPVGEAWDLLPTGPDEALLAGSHAIWNVVGARAERLTNDTVYARRLIPSSRSDIVYAGTESGYAVLRRTGAEAWSVAAQYDDVGGRVLTLVEPAPGQLLLGCDECGVVAVQVDLARESPDETARAYLNEDDGLAYGPAATANVFDLGAHGVFVTTLAGVYRWTDGRFTANDLDGLAALRSDDVSLGLAVAPDGGLWAHTYANVWRRAPDAVGWVDQRVHSLARGVVVGPAFGAGQTLFAAGNRVLVYEDQATTSAPVAPDLVLRSARRVSAAAENRTELPLAEPADVATGRRSGVEFEWAWPDYGSEQPPMFRTRLIGPQVFESDWQTDAAARYLDLPVGSYELHVHAQGEGGVEIERALFAMTVRAPWYATDGMRAAFVVVLMALAAVVTHQVARWRMRRLRQEAQRLEDVVRERTVALRHANRKLDAMAHADGLTGIANRRRLEEFLDECAGAVEQEGSELAVALIDVDHFKRYNDERGHLAGDELLKRLAALLNDGLDERWLLARYGGEEFVLVMPGQNQDAALRIAERLRRRVEEAGLGTSVSVGVASLAVKGGAADDALKRLVGAADQAMYQAKSDGRNRVVAAA